MTRQETIEAGLVLGLLAGLLAWLYLPSEDDGAMNENESVYMKFVREHWLDAKAVEQQFQIPAEFVLAQAAHESDLGRSNYAMEDKNFFGMKAIGWKGPVSVRTSDGGDHFRHYNSAVDSFLDFGRLIAKASRYVHAYALAKAGDDGYFAAVQAAGYSTDKKYGPKSIARLEQINAAISAVGMA